MNRIVNIPNSHSFFLFGARGTGKTWLLSSIYRHYNAIFIDLLEPKTFNDFSQRPGLLSDRIALLPEGEQWVIIDEVQKVPEILNMVHLEIEAHSRSQMGVTEERPSGRKIYFALTGSSARKLKRGRANLLAGRAFLKYLYPLTHEELIPSYSVDDVLSWGSLPSIVFSNSSSMREEFLFSYVHTYLKEEILEEQLAREAPPFRRFLEIAAQSNGEVVNYSSIGRDVGLSPNTVQSYYQILEDTLLAYQVPPYHRSIRKRQKTNPKYYFFDIGVQRMLMGAIQQPILPSSYGFGRVFEHFVFLEMYRMSSYLSKDYTFSYLQTKSNLEIDFIIERPGLPTAVVEIKSTEDVQDRHLKALLSLGKGIKGSELFCLSRDTKDRLVSGVKVLHWKRGLAELGLLRSTT